MRPAKAAPVAPFANSPLRQHPNDCVSDRRGIPDPVAPFKPPCLNFAMHRRVLRTRAPCERNVKQHTAVLFIEYRYAAHKHQLAIRGDAATGRGKPLRCRSELSQLILLWLRRFSIVSNSLQWPSNFKLRA